MLADEDEVEIKYPGTTYKDKLKRYWRRSILVNEKICKSCTVHLRSHGAIDREKERQLKDHPNIIHPFSTARIVWDVILALICLLQVVLIPLDAGLYNFTSTAPFISSVFFISIRMLLDLLCCVDIMLSFITGYYDESNKEVILDQKKIYRHYLKTDFVKDLITSIPTHFDLFINLRNGKNFVILHILQMISLLKLGRYFVFNRLVTKLCNILNIDFYIRHGALTVLALLLFWHSLSLIKVLFYVVTQNREIYAHYMNTTVYNAFSTIYYDGALMMCMASYGFQEPESTDEFVFTMFVWSISKFVQTYTLARVIEFIQAKTSPKLKYVQMVKQLVEFMRHKQLPFHTQKRILTYYAFHFQKCYFREAEIYATISDQLRQEIVMETCKQLVENVEFFKDLPSNLLIRIVSCLKSEIYLTNDVIIKANTQGNCMYFISTGTVAIYTPSGKEVCHLEDGAYFGEIALVNEDSQRVAAVIAVETCELYRLDRKDFVKEIHPYPDLLEKIQKIAADRMEKTNLMEEHYKRDIATKRFH